MQVAWFLLDFFLFDDSLLHNFGSYFLDNWPRFSGIFVDDSILGLRAILFLIVGRGEAKLVGIAVIFMMDFFLHIGAVAFERRSELFYHLFHFSSNA